MKKKWILILLALTVGLAACGAPAVETTAPVVETTVPVTETVPEAVQLPLTGEAMEFSFLSGAGGWSTDLTLNRDGSFAGVFHDSEMGEMGDEYPNGTVYICAFSGVFTDIQQVSEYAYAMKLSEIRTEHQRISFPVKKFVQLLRGRGSHFSAEYIKKFKGWCLQIPVAEGNQHFMKLPLQRLFFLAFII